MTDTSNVIQLPSATEPTEAMKTQYLNILKERAATLMQEVINENPAHVLVIMLTPDPNEVDTDTISVASTLPLRNPQDMHDILEVIHEALSVITSANEMPSDTEGNSTEG